MSYHPVLHQRIAVVVMATKAVFYGQILNADAEAASGGFKANRPSQFPSHFLLLSPLGFEWLLVLSGMGACFLEIQVDGAARPSRRGPFGEFPSSFAFVASSGFRARDWRERESAAQRERPAHNRKGASGIAKGP